MAELADAHGSGPCESNFMEVRILSPAPHRESETTPFFLYGDIVFSLFLWYNLSTNYSNEKAGKQRKTLQNVRQREEIK